MTRVSQKNNPSLAPRESNRKHVESRALKGTANVRREKCQKCWSTYWTSSCLYFFCWDLIFFSSYLKNPQWCAILFIPNEQTRKQGRIITATANISGTSYNRNIKQEVNNLMGEDRKKVLAFPSGDCWVLSDKWVFTRRMDIEGYLRQREKHEQNQEAIDILDFLSDKHGSGTAGA